ncbi:hypothetical protein FSP39_024711 [Pinctada imbricata]|uniref:C2H2-type domain-containing protein n=1 Tax=Pinctada imbricata TaxID=66713 RepID=A0AA88Y9V8_PINIB|nr:hypothetical protein FSP39_024711 [Pinctada imbricata]
MNRFEKAHIYMKDLPMRSYHPLLDHVYTKPYENAQISTAKCENVETDGYSIISCAYQEQDIDDQEVAVAKIESDDGERRIETSRLSEENSITATVDTKFTVDSKDLFQNIHVENKGVEESIGETFEDEFAQKEKVIHCELKEIEMDTSSMKNNLVTNKNVLENKGEFNDKSNRANSSVRDSRDNVYVKKEFDGACDIENNIADECKGQTNKDGHVRKKILALPEKANSTESDKDAKCIRSALEEDHVNIENFIHSYANDADYNENDKCMEASGENDDVNEKSIILVYKDNGDFEIEMNTSQKCILDANECAQEEHVSMKEENIMYKMCGDAHDAGNKEGDRCKGAQLSDLKKHQRTHTKEKTYKCDECGYSTAEGSNLKKHQRTHTGEKPYKCDKCEYRTAYSNALNRHQRTHAVEKSFNCDKCDYRTAYLSYLKRHQRKHAPEKSYKCDKCGYRTAYLRSLKEHQRTHAAENPSRVIYVRYLKLTKKTPNSI